MQFYRNHRFLVYYFIVALSGCRQFLKKRIIQGGGFLFITLCFCPGAFAGEQQAALPYPFSGKNQTQFSPNQLDSKVSVNLFKNAWLDLGFTNLYPVSENPLAELVEKNYGGMFRFNFNPEKAPRLWIVAGGMINANVPNHPRIETYTDYGLSLGAGYRFDLPLLFKFTPRFSYGIMLHSLYGNYYNSCVCETDPVGDAKTQDYFLDQFLQYELDLAYDISRFTGSTKGELFVAPSFVQIFEKANQGLEYGYTFGFRMKLPSLRTAAPVASAEGFAELVGKVIDLNTGKSVEGALSILSTLEGALAAEAQTIQGESFAYQLEPGKAYSLKIEREDYKPFVYEVNPEAVVPGERITLVVPLAPETVWGISGQVLEKTTGEPIGNVEVSVKPVSAEGIAKTALGEDLWSAALAQTPVVTSSAGEAGEKVAFTDSNGQFKIEVGKDALYDIVLKKEGYMTVHAAMDMQGKKPGWYDVMKFINTPMEQIRESSVIDFGNILFESGNWVITSEGAAVLNKMARFLLDNPRIVAEIGAHTDSQGDARSNLELSQKRAQSAVDYLIHMGIPEENLEAKGYGETRLLNQCNDRIACSAKEHQINRRIELTIIRISGN